MEIWIWAERYHISGEAGGRLIWGVWGAEPPSEYPITIIRFLRVCACHVLLVCVWEPNAPHGRSQNAAAAETEPKKGQEPTVTDAQRAEPKPTGQPPTKSGFKNEKENSYENEESKSSSWEGPRPAFAPDSQMIGCVRSHIPKRPIK